MASLRCFVAVTGAVLAGIALFVVSVDINSLFRPSHSINVRAASIGASTDTTVAAALAELRAEVARLRAAGTAAGSPSASAVDVAEVQPVALPSVRLDAASAAKDDVKRGGQYGGKGDKSHLGGFTQYDYDGLSPDVWRMIMKTWTVKSVIDVGCGRGLSTLWFLTHGARVKCVEGSHDAVERTVLPMDVIVEHDFARGPWWPKETYDFAWSVEFLEHVGRPYMHNYLNIFHKAAIILVTHSVWGGWHHVEVHQKEWWIRKFQMQGFIYSQELVDMVKSTALAGKSRKTPNNKTYHAQHLWTNALVFLNPKVASLHDHDHLFHEPGCSGGIRKALDCKDADALPERYFPLPGASGDDTEWEAKVFGKE